MAAESIPTAKQRETGLLSLLRRSERFQLGTLLFPGLFWLILFFAVPLVDKDGNDNFQAIKGIGPVFAKRLKESGVTTFEQLSRLKSKPLEEILGTLYKRFYSKQEAIVAQAKEFAKQRAQNS